MGMVLLGVLGSPRAPSGQWAREPPFTPSAPCAVLCPGQYGYDGEIQARVEGLPAQSHAWLYEEVSAWLAESEPETRALFIEGGPGLGKSTIAANLCHKLQKGGRLVAHFFCNANNSVSQDPEVVCYSLACQLVELVEGLRERLIEALRSLDVQPGIRKLLETVLLTPLKGLSVPEGTLLLVDGVDEGSNDPQEFNAVLQIVGVIFPKMPKQV